MHLPDSPESTPLVRSASEQAILLSALKDAIGKAYERGRQAAIAEMERAGSLKQLITSSDGTELGTIGTSAGAWVVDVDLDVVLDWALEHRPGEVIQPAPRLIVREPFVDWLRADAIRRAKVGQPPHPVTMLEGSEETVPGVVARWKPGNVTVNANSTAKARAAHFLDTLFETARGLPAQSGDTDGQHHPTLGADRDGGPSAPAQLGGTTAHAPAHVLGGADLGAAGAGGPSPGPGAAGRVVPGPAGAGHGRAESAGAQLADRLLGAVAGRHTVPYAHYLAYPDAHDQPVLDTFAEPESECEPFAEPDYERPAPF